MRFKISFILSFLLLQSCKINYSFSGINIPSEVKTYQIDYIPNNADYIVPGMNEDLRNQIIDRINRQTSLSVIDENGDLIFNCEITEYDVQPISLTSQQTAAQNRLTFKVKVNYVNNKKEDDNFNKTYSFQYDYPAEKTREEIQDEANTYLFEKFIDALFNDTLAKW